LGQALQNFNARKTQRNAQRNAQIIPIAVDSLLCVFLPVRFIITIVKSRIPALIVTLRQRERERVSEKSKAASQ
jgi:hypothetical protein